MFPFVAAESGLSVCMAPYFNFYWTSLGQCSLKTGVLTSQGVMGGTMGVARNLGDRGGEMGESGE